MSRGRSTWTRPSCLLGSLEHGRSRLFPRAADVPPPASDDALSITGPYVDCNGGEWVEQSPFPTAMGVSDDRAAKPLEAFAHRYAEAETVFTFRAYGEVERCRLELGTLVPVEEDKRADALRVVQWAFSPAPVTTPRPTNLRRRSVTSAPDRIGS